MKKGKKILKSYLLAGCLIFVMAAGCGCGSKNVEDGEHSQVQPTEEVGDASGQTVPGVNPTKEPEKFDFPVALDSDKLQLGSVFEYTGMNPDCEEVYGEEIGAIQLKNVSGSYLKSAAVTVTLSNGDVLKYLAQEVPADMEIMAFDTANTVYDDTYRVEDIQVDVEYGESADSKMVTWSVSGSEITVENKSDQEMKNVTIYYHCVIDDLGYGGKAYEMSVEKLQPGEAVTVTDSYCYVGDVKVSNVTYE